MVSSARFCVILRHEDLCGLCRVSSKRDMGRHNVSIHRPQTPFSVIPSFRKLYEPVLSTLSEGCTCSDDQGKEHGKRESPNHAPSNHGAPPVRKLSCRQRWRSRGRSNLAVYFDAYNSYRFSNLFFYHTFRQVIACIILKTPWDTTYYWQSITVGSLSEEVGCTGDTLSLDCPIWDKHLFPCIATWKSQKISDARKFTPKDCFWKGEDEITWYYNKMILTVYAARHHYSWSEHRLSSVRISRNVH